MFESSLTAGFKSVTIGTVVFERCHQAGTRDLHIGSHTHTHTHTHPQTHSARPHTHTHTTLGAP
jgi:hypothetical protein